MILKRCTASLMIASVILLTFGCKKVEPHFAVAAPTPTMTTGWNYIVNNEQGLSIGAAPGWAEKDPNVPETLSQLGVDQQKSMMGGNSELEKMAEEGNNKAKADEEAKKKEREGKGLYLTLYLQTKGTVGETTTRYSVKKVTGSGPASMDDAVQMAKDDMTNENAPTDVTLPIGPAKRIESDLSLKDGGTVTTIKYAMVNGNDTVIVTFITEADPNLIKTIEKPVMESFRVKPNS